MSVGAASHSPGSGEYAVRSEINVTPLVDVCLVLLIIFMVVTPLLQEGVDVTLPETNNPATMAEGQKQLDLAIKLDGTVFVGQNWVPEESLLGVLRDIYGQTPEKDVVIKADQRLRYDQVRSVMRTVQQAGFGGVGLEARRRDTSGGGGT